MPFRRAYSLGRIHEFDAITGAAVSFAVICVCTEVLLFDMGHAPVTRAMYRRIFSAASGSRMNASTSALSRMSQSAQTGR